MSSIDVTDSGIDFEQALGLKDRPETEKDIGRRRLYINLKLASSGQPVCEGADTGDFINVAYDLLESYREKSRLLTDYLCPADRRIQNFLDQYLGDLELAERPRLPGMTIVLDRHGVARELSLPADDDHFAAQQVESFRVAQGVLHNTFHDRRTTKGSFHIAEGGLPIPGDKKAVPKMAFARMLYAALRPPEELLRLPFTSNQEQQAQTFVSLLLRPVVCPEVPGREAEKRMEIRFFAPGSMVCNLDFVESIFGNAGNPYLAEHDAALDAEHWTGHTGCVILAPHILGMTKKDLGLPHTSDASDRQIADGMCWEDADELYNDGAPFKLTARDRNGVIVTILTDNYFGYCKKEVKTQIGYSANLYGLAEEEHAGGALAFPRRNHGDEAGVDSRFRETDHNFTQVQSLYGDVMDVQPEGYGIDKRYPDLIYIPDGTLFDLPGQRVSWNVRGGEGGGEPEERSIKLRPGKVYMYPSGYKVHMEKYPAAPSWRLIGTNAEGTFCHKPCTVSGGGKSEISKSIDSSVIYRPLFVADLEADLDQVETIINRDYSDRLLPELRPNYSRRGPSRPLLSPQRSLGSVIKLLTPSPSTFTPEYNNWVNEIPDRIRSMVFLIKRFYRPDWGDNWRAHFTVDIINGVPGNELKYDHRPVIVAYLRVGMESDSTWRIYKVRQDFIAAAKVQMEDDITASVVVPADQLLNRPAHLGNPSLKLAHNCEYRLFQRPDEAIEPGYDVHTERDMSRPGNFLANYQALDHQALTELVEDTITFSKYSPPMAKLLRDSLERGEGYVVSSAHPRLVDGKPSKNPRYLQLRPDLENHFDAYVAQMGTRLFRRVPLDQAVCFPVDAVLTGRRNNPPEPGIRPLAVYNPIHYQELPELFMDFVCSLTGKSPSTTGAGTEGALTKGPFNALRPTVDLNNALVSYILTGYGGFSSAAGFVGPNRRVDHDISLLIPEIWARLEPEARTPEYLIAKGFLEPVEDFEHEGRLVPASRLGYRITSRFVHGLMGKIFNNPTVVFDEALLRPETQGLEPFIDGIDNIVEAQQRVAQRYLDDGSIEDACPPLKALLYIMAEGNYHGHDAHAPEIRAMFTREALLASDWYRQRLLAKQRSDIARWTRHVEYLQAFLDRPSHSDQAQRLGIDERLQRAKATLERVRGEDYPDSLVGTLGLDPSVL